MKLQVLLAQPNHQYQNSVFLPYSVGLLQSFAQKDPLIRSQYEFLTPIFRREKIADVVQRVGRVDILACSVYIWNSSYCLALAKAIKEANPHCLVVLGGPHVPVESKDYFHLYPYADLLVHYEGEQAFYEVLLKLLDNQNWWLTGQPPLTPWESVEGLSLHCPDGSALKTEARERIHDLDDIPSPYLSGVFDELLTQDHDWHVTWEGTRGCPFACTFLRLGKSHIIESEEAFRSVPHGRDRVVRAA